MRTTLNIDTPVLHDLKRLRAATDKSLSELASELLAEAIARRAAGRPDDRPALKWHSQPMGARIDLDDKEAVYAALEMEET